MELLRVPGGAVHDGTDRSVPASRTTRTARQQDQQARIDNRIENMVYSGHWTCFENSPDDMEVVCGNLSQVDSAGSMHIEGQGVGVKLLVPVKTKSNSLSENEPAAQEEGCYQAVN